MTGIGEDNNAMTKIAEWIFKMLALAVAAIWVFTYWHKRDDGRYVYYERPPTAEITGKWGVVDTRTGTLYAVENGHFWEINLRTGFARELKQQR